MFGVKAALLARSAPLGILAARRMISMEALNYSHAKIAVVLSGCGLFDGTEIHEASAILVTLSRHLASVTMFAPNILQTHVINHLTGEEMDPERNVLVESARIARGKIRPLKELKAKDFAAVIFPGGFGVAKNLSTFAVDEHRMDVNPQVEDVLKEFHEAEKPIGLCCISPVLVAALFKGVEVTVGADKVIPGKWPHATTAGVIVTMGAVHVPTDVNEIYIDHRHKIVSTAAYMCEAPHHVIFDAISTMVRQVLLLTPSK